MIQRTVVPLFSEEKRRPLFYSDSGVNTFF
jgi:hypothetical protein